MEKLATSSMQPIDNSHKLHACIFHSIIWIMEEKFRKERSIQGMKGRGDLI